MRDDIAEAMHALRDADPAAGAQITAEPSGLRTIVDGSADDVLPTVAPVAPVAPDTGSRTRSVLSVFAAAACTAVLAVVGLHPGSTRPKADQRARLHALSATTSASVSTARLALRVGDLADPTAFNKAAAARGLRATATLAPRTTIAVLPTFPGPAPVCRADQRYPEWTKAGTALTFPAQGTLPEGGHGGGILHIVLVNLPAAILTDPQAVVFWLDSTPVPIHVEIMRGSSASGVADTSVSIAAPTSSCRIP